jgi:hypothetical protein
MDVHNMHSYITSSFLPNLLKPAIFVTSVFLKTNYTSKGKSRGDLDVQTESSDFRYSIQLLHSMWLTENHPTSGSAAPASQIPATKLRRCSKERCALAITACS